MGMVRKNSATASKRASAQNSRLTFEPVSKARSKRPTPAELVVAESEAASRPAARQKKKFVSVVMEPEMWLAIQRACLDRGGITLQSAINEAAQDWLAKQAR